MRSPLSEAILAGWNGPPIYYPDTILPHPSRRRAFVTPDPVVLKGARDETSYGVGGMESVSYSLRSA